jgi:hypothetical protein
MLAHEVIERLLAGVPERRVAEVMPQTGCFDERSWDSEVLRQRSADLRNLD